jgi:ribosome-binding protein aMBF1 (putative translation factor)
MNDGDFQYLPASAMKASAVGSAYYFSGVPCKNKHISKRKTVNRTCYECERIGKAKNIPSKQAKEKRKIWEASPRGKTAIKNARVRWQANKWKQYDAKKRADDPQYLIRKAIRSRMGSARRQRQISGSALQELGCSIDDFISYIESRPTWNPEWSWSELGRLFHLDHIRPLGSFDLADRTQFLTAVHYTNMQPLSTDEHKRKTIEDLRLIRSRKIMGLHGTST